MSVVYSQSQSEYSTTQTHLAHHNLAQKHVFEGAERALIGFIHLNESLEGFKEVGITSLIILVVGIDGAGLKIELGLQNRRTVDAVGCGAR